MGDVIAFPLNKGPRKEIKLLNKGKNGSNKQTYGTIMTRLTLMHADQRQIIPL